MHAARARLKVGPPDDAFWLLAIVLLLLFAAMARAVEVPWLIPSSGKAFHDDARSDTSTYWTVEDDEGDTELYDEWAEEAAAHPPELTIGALLEELEED